MSFLTNIGAYNPFLALKMVILGFKASNIDKKQNSLLLAHIMHIAHFLNL